MGGLLQTFNNLTYSKEKQSDGRLKLNVEISNERFEIAKKRVYERLAPAVKLSGFRPGKAPRNLIEAKLGPSLFEETLGSLLPECTLEIIQRESLRPLDQIVYKIEKVAVGSGVKYSATFTVIPKFKLPNLSKIKVRRKKVEVSDEEVEKVIEQMFRDGQARAKEVKNVKKSSDKPKIDDKWAESLPLGVKNLDELRKKVKSELRRQKENVEDNRFLGEILKEIGRESKIDVPQVLIDQEVARREKEYRKRIENLGMKVEDFLRNQKTSFDELRKGWKEEAGDAIRAEMILMEVAKEYGIKVESKEIDDQINAIKDENLKRQYQTGQARRYITSVLLRQKIVKKILELVKGS